MIQVGSFENEKMKFQYCTTSYECRLNSCKIEDVIAIFMCVNQLTVHLFCGLSHSDIPFLTFQSEKEFQKLMKETEN